MSDWTPIARSARDPKQTRGHWHDVAHRLPRRTGHRDPAGWDLSGGLGALSADGTMLAGWGFGPLGMQSYVVRFEDAAADTVFADGFDGSP